jgi:hypothetical protein
MNLQVPMSADRFTKYAQDASQGDEDGYNAVLRILRVVSNFPLLSKTSGNQLSNTPPDNRNIQVYEHRRWSSGPH